MPIYRNKKLRRIVLPILNFFNPGKISIKHHYTGKKIVLDAFHHKGYWYHGKKREFLTMEIFRDMIKPDFIIIEIGGHIGYITNYFSSLLSIGKVYVFEPGMNNLPYLQKNIQSLNNVIIIEKAVSNNNGKAKFYIENLSGQNNSLLPQYASGDAVEKMAFVKVDKKEVEVETITLDTFCESFSVKPDFIKIDIEGAEMLALEGMLSTLKKYTPLMMIEITENWSTVSVRLKHLGYKLFNAERTEVSNNHFHSGNTFCLHEKHSSLIKELSFISIVN